ncbi:putative bifunctional diguanylate cyclase/phosphodiesterase [Marinobacter zhejiangensis]|uniref:PAS domain S-box-containing protein/diguanylate cyclase (GGDEF) domain-containing protein n=1 Tax=Marinobacter zhejiangensis TaxID=488535 RepID=A0A1I4L0Z6_9GAMM|nr:EAL domain-containing protein [Marinobacter zhejiangensis]SFL84526.1 PAS domain S-box-containing protein/diguanylate cyclase (GGDEF) domain-containing protein [Marinobacter zhejiangensis]
MEALSERSFKQLVDQHPRAILLATDAPQILYVNQQFCRVTGYDWDEIIGCKPSVLSSGLHSEDFYRAMWQSLASLGRWEGVIWNRRKCGQLYPQWLRIFQIDQEGRKLYAGAFLDVSELSPQGGALESMAYFDDLTDLPNRRLFREFLDARVSQGDQGGGVFAVVYVDLDFFKGVNDLHGHDVGDALLRQASLVLRQVIQEPDVLARLSGDEFAAIIDLGAGREGLEALGPRIVEAFQGPLVVADKAFFLSVSVGAAVFPDDGRDGDSLLKHSDCAMYSAKSTGGGCFRRYREEESEPGLQHQRIAEALVASLKTMADEFSVVYQPQFELLSGQPVGIEVLVRWHHPEFGAVSPAEFIPIAEQRGLMALLTERVTHMVAADLSDLTPSASPGLGLAFNVSAGQFADCQLEQLLTPLLEQTRRLGWVPELEITETQLMGLTSSCLKNLEHLEQCGVRIALDDFGTGYSSLAYLHTLPIHTLKIDRQFIASLTDADADCQIVSAILGMARALGLNVLAEGIETPGQRERLIELGCTKGQGYLLAEPMEWSDLCQVFLI